MTRQRIESILVIEDDGAIRDTLVSILGDEGYRVRAASNGQEALDILSALSDVCLLLVDVTMPIMSGWDFLEAFEAGRHGWPAHRVVVFSAAGDAPKAAAQRGYNFLPKPFELDKFLQDVARFCATDLGGLEGSV